jgi:hypothetical protein
MPAIVADASEESRILKLRNYRPVAPFEEYESLATVAA